MRESPVGLPRSAGEARLGPRVRHHLRMAWPVFVIFFGQRLLTVAFVARRPQGLWALSHRWDAGWYLRLARTGYLYPNIGTGGRIHGSNLAFFPLFPWLVDHLSSLTHLPLDPALIVVSWLGGLLAVWAIFAVGHVLYGRQTGIALSALWGMAPASLALTMGYPEGLFTAAAAGALYCLMRRRPILAALLAIAAGLLRPTAVAVITMVWAYCLVELIRWITNRRPRPDKGAPDRQTATDVRHRHRPDRAPVAAILGVVLSPLGVGAFMIYVFTRTGELTGYFTVQAQWGQRVAGFHEYLPAIQAGLFGRGRVDLVPVTIAAAGVYLLLFCMLVFDRKLLWASIYAAVVLAISLSHIKFQHAYDREILPAFVLLLPLARLRVPRLGAIAALTVGSVLMSWGGAQLLFDLKAAI